MIQKFGLFTGVSIPLKEGMLSISGVLDMEPASGPGPYR